MTIKYIIQIVIICVYLSWYSAALVNACPKLMAVYSVCFLILNWLNLFATNAMSFCSFQTFKAADIFEFSSAIGALPYSMSHRPIVGPMPLPLWPSLFVVALLPVISKDTLCCGDTNPFRESPKQVTLCLPWKLSRC